MNMLQRIGGLAILLATCSSAKASEPTPVPTIPVKAVAKTILGLADLSQAVDLVDLVSRMTENQGKTKFQPGSSPLLKKVSLSFDFTVPDVVAATYFNHTVQGYEVPLTRSEVFVHANMAVTAKLEMSEIELRPDPKKPNIVHVILPKPKLEAKPLKAGQFAANIKYGKMTNESISGDRATLMVNQLCLQMEDEATKSDGAILALREYKRVIEEEVDTMLSNRFKSTIFIVKFRD